MNRIDKKFQKLRAEGKKAAIPFLTAGFPSPAASLTLARELAENGADIIELGVPFSDPVADGPTIQASSAAALARGMTLEKVLRLAENFRRGTETPLVLMGYLNPFLAMGIGRLARRLAAAGVDGLIIPDLPVEESDFLRIPLAAAGIHLIFLAAPNTPPKKMARIAKRGRGFIYYVSRAGVTGARDRLEAGLAEKVSAIKKTSPLPVCVGFGVSRRGQVIKLNRIADGVIVGSALIAPFLRLPPGKARAAAIKKWRELFGGVPEAGR